MLWTDTNFDPTDLPRLTGSQVEAQEITEIAGRGDVSEFRGFAATPAAAMQMDWHDYSIADFAAHAIIDSVHPELSGIVLSTLNREGTPVNGVLSVKDIYQMPIPVSLVVLSGCGTASGKSIPGEGIVGLAHAFLSSGASGVVGTLWPINDQTTGEMIPIFYRALLDRHLTISAALRAMQLSMLEQHKPPYDWAGYIVEGDWRIGRISSAI